MNCHFLAFWMANPCVSSLFGCRIWWQLCTPRRDRKFRCLQAVIISLQGKKDGRTTGRKLVVSCKCQKFNPFKKLETNISQQMGRGKSSSKGALVGDMLVPERVSSIQFISVTWNHQLNPTRISSKCWEPLDGIPRRIRHIPPLLPTFWRRRRSGFQIQGESA